jgi:hypothetical protein
MAQTDLLKSVLSGTAPRTARMLAARGLVPAPPNQMLEMLVALLRDNDQELAAQAGRTLAGWSEDEIIAQLRDRRCAPSVLKYFATEHDSDSVVSTAIMNPALPGELIESIALTVTSSVLETILENRTRIVEFPGILRSIKLNPSLTAELRRVVQEIETEFFSGKKIEYVVERTAETGDVPKPDELPEFDFLPDDLSLEDLPADAEARQAVVQTCLAKMSFRDKLRYALFGTREIRAMLVRDSNREVARMVLRSPKITENEIESIAAMRSVAEDILREIGNSNQWTKSYGVVQGLVKNPKTPPAISQRLLSRLHSNDLMLLTRDRSVSDAVRHNATRTLKQRKSATSPK